MPRTLPIVDTSWAETHDIVRIQFPDGTVKRLGTAKMTNVPVLIHDATSGMITDTGNYAAHLMQSSSTKQTLTQAADRVTVSIQNVDRAIGLTLNNVATSLIGASVVFAKVFKDTDGSWKSSPLCYGEIADVQVDENIAEVTIVSDTAPNVRFLSNRPLSTTCPLTFKGAACGYVGPLTTCNKKRDDPDGCAGRNNVHRFGGIIAEGEISEPVVGDGFGVSVGTGGGGDSGGGVGTGDLFPDPSIRFRLPDKLVQ